MSVLAKCVQSGDRVRVHVRGINRIRGFAIGTLVSHLDQEQGSFCSASLPPRSIRWVQQSTLLRPVLPVLPNIGSQGKRNGDS